MKNSKPLEKITVFLPALNPLKQDRISGEVVIGVRWGVVDEDVHEH
jgi:hypothetical protein